MKRLLIALIMFLGIIGTAVAEDKHATVKVSADNFAELRDNTPLLVVDFWATWCGPCLRLAPILEDVAASMQGKVVIGKCDVDSCDDIVAQYRVRNIPTVVFIKGGEVVDKVVGATSKETLKAKVDALL